MMRLKYESNSIKKTDIAPRFAFIIIIIIIIIITTITITTTTVTVTLGLFRLHKLMLQRIAFTTGFDI
jgi:hypothetical protein